MGLGIVYCLHQLLIVLQTLDKGEGQDKETAFVRNLRTSIHNRKPLRVNRRGLVKLSEEVESQCSVLMSYIAIGSEAYLVRLLPKK